MASSSRSTGKTGKRRPQGSHTPADVQKGLESRVVATLMVSLVVRKKASMEDLAGGERSLTAWKKLNERDRALARAIALTTLRHRMRILAVLEKCWNRKPPQKAHFLIHTLETAAAQILFMDVPESAAVNLAISAIRRERATNRFAGFANAVLRALVREKNLLLEQTADTVLFPPFLSRRLSSDYGREKLRMASRMIAHEPVLDLQGKPGSALPASMTMPLPGVGGRLIGSAPVSEIEGYAEGNWWVQDIAAAQPVRLLGDVRRKRVADLCAAPGGKTMQLAARGVDVTAVDISKHRLERLRENLQRTRLNATLVCVDLLEWEPEEPFDAVLLDAPCSATGTVRRHPDILWNTDEEQVTALIALQKRMIEKAAGFLRPGGILVYANCSILKAEGEDLVAELKTPSLVPDLIREEELPGLNFCINGRGQFRSLPHYLPLEPQEKSGMDGFFAVRFLGR